MAWFSRFTRFGDVHLVYGQEHGCSCGIASVMMCVFKINKLEPGKTSITVEKNIKAEYNKYDTGGDDVEGTAGDCLAKVLDKFTSGTWNWKEGGTSPKDVTDLLLDKVGIKQFGPIATVNPVILGVDWDQGGAHWVVVDTIREFMGDTIATVCDPWDANVHMQKFKKGQAFFYDASSGGFMINFSKNALAKDSKDFKSTVGGGPGKDMTKKPYTNSSKGQVKHWGIVYRDP